MSFLSHAHRVARRLITDRQYMMVSNAMLHAGLNKSRVRPVFNCYLVEDDFRRLYVAAAKRASLYRRGIADRLRFLENRYSLDDRVRVVEGDVVVDVGANIGEWSVQIAPRASRLVSIDGDPFAYPCLSLNLSPFEKAEAVHALVWHSHARIEFNLAPEGADSSALSATDSAVGVLRKDAVPLDDLLDSLQLTRVDFLKLDAEGAEPEVLAGAHRTLKSTGKVAIDCGPERFGRTTHAEAAEILNSSGLRTEIVNDTMLFGWR